MLFHLMLARDVFAKKTKLFDSFLNLSGRGAPDNERDYKEQLDFHR